MSGSNTEAIKETLNNACDLAAQLEKGQADTPLTDLFNGLTTELNKSNFSITLLCLDKLSKANVLRWLYGQDFALFSVQVTSQIGLIEIHLREKGYLFEKSTGQREEYENWEQFMGAIEESEILNTSFDKILESPPLLETQTGTGLKNLHVLFPDNPSLIQQHPALLTRLVSNSNLLVIATQPSHNLTELEQSVIDDLLVDFPACWPLLVVDELSQDASIPEYGWWQQIKPNFSIPAKLLPIHTEAPLPPFLTEPGNPLRQLLHVNQIAKRTTSAVAAIEDRYQQTLRQLQNRQQREQRRTGHGKQSAATLTQSPWSRARATISNNIQSINKLIEESNRQFELKGGGFDENLKEFLATLNTDCLNNETAYKTIKLSLKEDYLRDLTAFIKKSVKETLKKDLQSVNEQLDKYRSDLEKELSEKVNKAISLGSISFDNNTLWSEMKETLGFEISYKGELPKRGFLDRLSEGRRSVFVILMSFTILGYLGINMRKSVVIGILMVMIFFGGIAYTFISWRKEDAYRLEKEIEKVKTEILQATRRLVSEINRMKAKRISEYMDKLKSDWNEQLEDLQQKIENQDREEKNRSENQAQQRIKTISQQINDWQQYQLQVERIRRSADDRFDESRNSLSQYSI